MENNSFYTNNNSNALINEHQSLLNNNSDDINNNNKTILKNNNLEEPIYAMKDSENNETFITYLKYAFAFCIAGALFSFVIALLGIFLNIKTVTTIPKFFIVFGFCSMLIFLFGLWSLHQYIKFLREGENGMGTGSFALKKEAKSYVTALGQDASEWQKVFKDSNYPDIESSMNTVVIVIGISSLSMIALIIGILVFSFCVVNSFRFRQTMVQYFCLIFFSIGAILLYIALFANIFKDTANVHNSMPVWVPLSLFACAVIAITFAIFGYIAIQAKAKFSIRLFCFITVISSIVICACSVYAFLYSDKLETIFNGQCKVILNIIPEDFLIENAICGKKYVTVKTFEPKDCPKERILLAWDRKLKIVEKIQAENTNSTQNATSHIQKVEDLFGCYDNLCCTASYNMIASKSNYMKLIAASLFVAGVLCALGSYSVFDDLELRSDNNYNKNNNSIEADLVDFEGKRFCTFANVILLLLLLTVFGVSFWAIYTLPRKPIQDPSSNVLPDPSENTKVSTDFVVNKHLNKTVLERIKVIREYLKNETKFEEKKACGENCPVLRYYFELSSEDGEFTRNKTADWKNLIMKQDGYEGNKYVVKFEGDSRVLNTLMEFFEFSHKCPMLPSKIRFKISGEVNPPPTFFIQNKMNSISYSEIFSEQKNTIKGGNDNNNDIYNKDSNNNKNFAFKNMPTNSGGLPNHQTASVPFNSFVSLKSTGVIDYSTLKVGEKFELMNKTIDYSFVSETSQVIKGKVFKREDSKTDSPIKGAEVLIENLDFPQCSSYKLYTDEKGEFTSPKLFIFNEKMKSSYRVTVNVFQLSVYTRTVFIGGLGASAEIDLGNILLWSVSIVELADLSATVLNSINNEPIENVRVSIYQGFIEFNNEELVEKKPLPFFAKTAKFAKSFLEIYKKKIEISLEGNKYNNLEREYELGFIQTNQKAEANVYKVSVSDYRGVYDIKELPPNLYTLVFEKEGFYRETLSKLPIKLNLVFFILLFHYFII